MSLYQLKPGTPFEAAPYTSGLEDGFISFTSATVLTNPIPVNLQPIAVLWDNQTGDDWTISIPYVGSGVALYPDDYVLTPDSGPKTRMGKTEFESQFEEYFAP